MTDILATAPGRCGIVGNPTDMYGGSVISCTTRERASCQLQTHAATGITVSNGDETALLVGAKDRELRNDRIDIARAAFTYFDIDPREHRFRLTLTTAIPMRAGLSGSTALLAAIVGALDAYLALHLHRYALAETTRKIEARIMKVVCGHQDQHMAIFGGLNFMDFRGKESLEQVPGEPYATVEPLANVVSAPPLLLAHTGIQHHSGTVHQSPRERWLAGETRVRDSYAEIAQLARQGKRPLIDRDWEQLGALMNRNHVLVADLGGSGPANERLIAAARSAGVWGAKLAGAGGGGTILVLTDEPARLSGVLLDAGAEQILQPGPEPGLEVAIR